MNSPQITGRWPSQRRQSSLIGSNPLGFAVGRVQKFTLCRQQPRDMFSIDQREKLGMAKAATKLDSTDSRKTPFSCQSPNARDVFLAGTFNDWDPTGMLMQRQGDGTWRAELELAPGTYEYKFVVDGVWCCDPGREDSQCEGCIPNSFGTMNRTLEVGA